MESEKRNNSLRSELYRDNYLNAYKVIIAGGRDFTDYEYMSKELSKLLFNSSHFDGDSITIMSGIAKGADTLAIQYADEHQMTKILFPANWKNIQSLLDF